ncbi:Bdr family repetitive protein [Candidatus Borrelia fainii]|uniref:Bdr family repetitive protein n=1 Tax=Candidatus Borrelia fainii TaxID=2518322 RepID=UPI002491D2F8|nr:Bdr family repetitive protein [Candidatus Borrelia fainii]
MGLAQPVITQQMVIAELTRAGINRDIAIDLAYRYYKNELTYKDIEYLETTFNLKLEKVEATLQSDIKDLDNKIGNVKNELKSDIKDLDNKIDTVENNLNSKMDAKFNELDNKIDTVKNELKSDIKDLDNKIDTVENNLNSKIDTKFNELDNKIDVNKMELKSTLRLHGWMFGTLITLNIGIFLTLMSIVYSLLNK